MFEERKADIAPNAFKRRNKEKGKVQFAETQRSLVTFEEGCLGREMEAKDWSGPGLSGSVELRRQLF